MVEKNTETPATFRGRIYNSVTEATGSTPLVHLRRFSEKNKLDVTLLGKLEYLNPAGSIKDRSVIAELQEAEKAGKIKPGKTMLMEAGGGNHAVSLAAMAASRGYSITIVMPENTPMERRKIITYLGAELIITPADQGMKGAQERAKEMAGKNKEDAYLFNQFESPAAIAAHTATADELWADTLGKIDILVCGIGTGATITGIAQSLKKRKPDFLAYAVEPSESPVLSGGKSGKHGIQGLGAGFIPPILDKKMIDGVVKIATDRAFVVAKEVARTEGLPVGISSGAALAAAIEVARLEHCKGKTIAVILSSHAERYLSSALFTP
jgi:cysteine synthase A